MRNNNFNVVYTKEKSWIVARCIEIDVVSQGKTMQSAQKNIKEAIELYIEVFGEPQIPEYRSKPVIKILPVPKYGKTTSSIGRSVNKISGKTRVRKAAAKRKSRSPAKTRSR